MKIKALVFLAVLVLISPVCGQSLLVIDETVVISKTSYSLRDLISADIPADLAANLDSIYLAKIPADGQSHYYSRQYLQYLLQQKKIPVEGFSIPARVKVSPLLVTISQEELGRSISNLIKKTKQNIHVSFPRDLAGLQVPLGSLEVKLETNKSWQIPGRNNIPVLINLDGQLWKRINAQVFLDEEVEILRLTKSLEAGESLSENDLASDFCLKSTLPQDYLSSWDFSDDLRARRNLEEDTVLTWSYLERKPLIERGDQLIIRLAIKGIQITVPGEAMEKGYQGDRIRVRNLTNGQVLNCLVEGKGEVTISGS